MDAPATIEDGLLEDRPRPFSNVPVCAKFFCFATGKSTNFLYQPCHPGSALALETSVDRMRPSPVEDAIVVFMCDLGSYYQLSPDTDLIFLPFPKRKFVHQLYMDEAPVEMNCTLPYFLSVWRKSPLTTHIKLRKHLRFALCDECIEFRDLQLKHQSSADRLELKNAQIKHHKFVKCERQLYYCRRDKGRDPAYNAMSMIVDAADQSKYALPYFHIATHSSQKAFRLPCHLMGVLVHGEAIHAYTYYESFKQGNNVTIEAIREALAVQLAKHGKLPDVLYLQLDNTSKQCKGRYIIGFLGWLVQLGIFKQIILSFLPVGHTHEDIDQVFSRLAVYLDCHDAFNVAQLHDAIKRSYQSREGHRAITGHWDRCANFSHWIKPFLSNYDGISRFRQFRFYKIDGVARVQARQHTSQKQEWAGIRGQDAWTPVFRQTPPSTMRHVPATQRRPIVTPKMVEMQRRSILRLVKARAINEDLVTTVLEGVDSLGDEAGLPFNWDSSRLANWKADGADDDMVDDESADEKVDDAAEHAYKYSVGDVVLLKPPPGAAKKFWLGMVVGLGEGMRVGEYEVVWLVAARDFGTYRQSRVPAIEWQFEESVQDSVKMISEGKKLSATSVTLVNAYVERWAVQDAQVTDDEDNDASASDDSGPDDMLL
jgi:hypothetical protein